MGNAKIIPRGFGAALLLVLLAGAVGGLGQWWAVGASTVLHPGGLCELLAASWEAAVVEEVLFRGVLLWTCLDWARRRGSAAWPAVAASSLVFGLFHLLPAGPLVAEGANFGIVLAQGVLKVTQATLFGMVMGMLVVCSAFDRCPFPRRALSLIAPLLVHGAFDLLFLGPLLLTGGALPSTYLTGNAAELVPLAATAILLAGAAKASFRQS